MGDQTQALEYYRKALEIYEALRDKSAADNVKKSIEWLGG
jgi:hypothetical protein